MTTRSIAVAPQLARRVLPLAGAAVFTAFSVAAPAGAVPGEVSFATHVDFATGGGPSSVTMGDLNGDGHLDLGTANFDGDSVSLLLGDGAGGFSTAADFVAQNATSSLVFVDLDGDTHLDVAATNTGSNTVSVWLGDGAGDLGARADIPVGLSPGAIVAGDVDGDAFNDLLVANPGSDSVSILFGDGGGGFAPRADYATEANPHAVALADLDDDSDVDMVVANGGGNTVSVRLGDGAGGFGALTAFDAGGGPSSIAVGHYNGDTSLDLAVGNLAPTGVSILLGDGAGGFGARTTVASACPGSVVTADVDGDGNADLVTANFCGSSVRVRLGDGAGGFPTSFDFLTGNGPEFVAVGHLDGDSNLDIVTANKPASSVSILVSQITPTAPWAPTIGNATGRHQSAIVSWFPPSWNGGSPITGYVVTPYIGYYPLPSQTFSSTATAQTITGLTNGTTYRFRVQAINAIGTSGYSKVTNAVTPAATVPHAPTIGAATAGNGRATVSWTAPASNGGSAVTGYVVTPYVGYWSGSPRVFSSTATSQTVTGLTNGWTYRFRVQAINGIGPSGYSKVTNPVTPMP